MLIFASIGLQIRYNWSIPHCKCRYSRVSDYKPSTTTLIPKHLHLFIFVQKNTQNYLLFPIKKVYLRINIISNKFL